MKRFRFPLRPVAVLRAHEELRAREAFARAVHAYVETEEALAQTQARVARFEAALFAGRAHTFSAAGEVLGLAGYRRECTAEMEAERVVITARAAMEEKRSAYLHAHQRLDVVEKLEVKARRVHQVENAKAEQAEFDDFAGRTHAVRARQKVSS